MVFDDDNVALVGLLGRLDTTLFTCYRIRYVLSSNTWQLTKIVNNVGTILGTLVESLSVGVHPVVLSMNGDQIKASRDGAEIISATNSDITAAGKSGVYFVNATPAGGHNIHIDNFSAVSV